MADDTNAGGSDTVQQPLPAPIPADPVVPLTYGEKAVGLSFNPSGDQNVTDAKKSYAAIIDQLDAARKLADNSEVARMLSVAITEAQTSQMWAVKAITWKA